MTVPPRLRAAGLALLIAAGTGAWLLAPRLDEARLARASLLALDARVRRQPGSAAAWYHYGARLREKGAADAAIEALRRARELAPDEERVAVALGRALLDADQVEEAFQLLKAAAAARPGSAEPRKLLARLYQRRGAYHRAEEEWREALRLRPRDADAWYFRAFCHLQMQQVELARGAVDRAVELAPALPRAHRLRASILAAAGDLAGARASFETAIRLDPADARGHHDLANFLLTQARGDADVARAVQAVDELARLEPEYPLLTWHRGRIAAFRGEWSEAAAALEETLRVEPALDEAHFHLAKARYRLGDRRGGDAAMESYRRRSELTRRMDEARIRAAASDDPAPQFALARLQREAGLLAQARLAVQEGLRRAPGSRAGQAELRLLEAAERRAGRSSAAGEP